MVRRIVTFSKKEKILTQGDAADAVSHIREGRLRITQKTKQSQLEKLIENLSLLISEMLELGASGLIGATEVHPDHLASARNFMHYVALRRHDIRHLQSELAALGLSSLGRTEPHVLSSLRAVLNILLKLAGTAPISHISKAAPQIGLGNHLLARNTEALLGEAPEDRHV
jgi:pyruvate kinase